VLLKHKVEIAQNIFNGSQAKIELADQLDELSKKHLGHIFKAAMVVNSQKQKKQEIATEE
jgi:hypothetical protein